MLSNSLGSSFRPSRTALKDPRWVHSYLSSIDSEHSTVPTLVERKRTKGRKARGPERGEVQGPEAEVCGRGPGQVLGRGTGKGGADHI